MPSVLVSGIMMRSILSTFLILGLCVASADAANEAGLLKIWNQHIATPQDHDALIKSCTAFMTDYPSDPLKPIAQDIEAWHKMQAGRDKEAWPILESHLNAPADPVSDGARLIAKGWLSRLDREKAVAALLKYYRNEVQFPENLEAVFTHPKIPATLHPPRVDRFGKPWVYQLNGTQKIPGFLNQKYALVSSELGDFSDLKKALAAPYAAQIVVKPIQVLPLLGDVTPVKFSTPEKNVTVLLTPGKSGKDFYLAYAGAQIIVVCDHMHWKVFPKP